MTNAERLQAALTACRAHYNRECEGFEKNESSWGMYVVEPVLEVLGWPRQEYVKLDANSDGAHFEWPCYKAADAALLAGGRLIAFGEFKQDEYGCRCDIRDHRDEYPKLQVSHTAFASWFGKGGGFGVYDLSNGSTPGPVGKNENVVRRLVRLARPVLLNAQTRDEWHNGNAGTDSLPSARLSVRTILMRFFTTLFSRLSLPQDREFRRRPVGAEKRRADHRPPHITFVHRDLYPRLPEGWGVTLSIDVIREQVCCKFYGRTDRPTRDLEKYRCTTPVVPAGDCSWVDQFIDRQVYERLEARRRLAPTDKVGPWIWSAGV